MRFYHASITIDLFIGVACVPLWPPGRVTTDLLMHTAFNAAEMNF